MSRRDIPNGNIFIYCDDASHPKRIAVTNFAPIGGLLASGWTEVTTGSGTDRTGRSIVKNAPAETGWANNPEISNAEHRNRYKLACRKCGDRNPVVAREETLFAVLSAIARAGESECSLSAFDAIVGRIDISRPELGLG